MSHEVLPAAAGGWLGFVSGPRALVVASASEDFIASAWAAIARDDAFQALLDLLTSHGLAATPAFVLVDWDPGADARVIVRGAAAVTVTDAAGATPLSGAGISTWVERTLPGVTALELTVPGATAAGSGYLPLAAGVALLAGLRMGAVAPALPPATAAAKPAPVAEKLEKPKPPVDVDATMVVQPERDEAKTEIIPKVEGDYDYLFGDTMYRSVSDAAVHEPGEEVSTTTEEPLSGDHDGETVLTSDIAKLRTPRKTRTASLTKPLPAVKLVLVVSTTGAREPLSQPVLVGRSPSVSKVSGGALPRLLTLGSIDQDISRNHAQFALEGDTVVVTDLHSRNGTSIVLPGKEPQKLRAGEPTSVIVGTVVDLGGGLTLTIEEDR